MWEIPGKEMEMEELHALYIIVYMINVLRAQQEFHVYAK